MHQTRFLSRQNPARRLTALRRRANDQEQQLGMHDAPAQMQPANDWQQNTSLTHLPLVQRQALVAEMGQSYGNRQMHHWLVSRQLATPVVNTVQREGEWTKIPAQQITLEFIPDERVGDDGEPMGGIHFRVQGQEVAHIDARGGRPMEGSAVDQNNPSRTYSATPAGRFRLAAGQSHVSRGYVNPRTGERVAPWTYSQLRWGTPIRDDDPAGGVLYQTPRGEWRSTMTLQVPIRRDDVLGAEENLQREPKVPATWDLNDFGQIAFRIAGGQGAFIHTTPENEAQYTKGLEERLEFSHGCIHIKPSDRERMVRSGLLRGGVRVVIREYRPETIKKYSEQ